MAKTLIAFYSRRGENWVDGSVRFLPKGNNEVIVEKIKALLPEADVFRIETVKKYSDDYMVCIEEAKQELRAKARPELTAKVENMDQYDTIILGYPNWWPFLLFWRAMISPERRSSRSAPTRAAAWVAVSARSKWQSRRPILPRASPSMELRHPIVTVK